MYVFLDLEHRLIVKEQDIILPIRKKAVYRPLYDIFVEVSQDIANAGLGMPTTFACFLSRLNSSNPAVVLEEQKRFEAIIKLSHSLVGAIVGLVVC